jgi:hypothetical protein
MNVSIDDIEKHEFVQFSRYFRLGTIAQMCNASDLGGGYQEDGCSRPARAKT